MILLTGRGSAAQWHTQTRTAKSAVLRKLYPSEIYVEINPHDAGPPRRSHGRSAPHLRRSAASCAAGALVTPAVQPGQVFLPMHYEATNLLTDAVFDPYSHQPAYKSCAVAVEHAT